MNVNTKVFVLNTGGTLGMVGRPLRPAKSAQEMFEGMIPIDNVDTNLADFERRQDSTNVQHSDRVEIAQQVTGVYDDHDAFVVLHGTDTIALTAGIFCMIFKLSLQKPIFLVGTQMSRVEAGNEVSMQIANTLRVAKSFHKH